MAVDKTGVYHYLSHPIDDSYHYADSIKDLTVFITKMIAYGLYQFIDFTNQRICDCVCYMESINIIAKKGKQHQLTD